jgi:hypothetical protein
MLQMYFLQHWFNLSDPAVAEALYDSPILRAFVGIDLGREPIPDETTVCKFRIRLLVTSKIDLSPGNVSMRSPCPEALGGARLPSAHSGG